MSGWDDDDRGAVPWSDEDERDLRALEADELDEGDEVELPAGHVVAAGPGILPKPIPAAGALVLAGATDPAPDGAVRFALSRLTDADLSALHERAERLTTWAYAEMIRRQAAAVAAARRPEQGPPAT